MSWQFPPNAGQHIILPPPLQIGHGVTPLQGHIHPQADNSPVLSPAYPPPPYVQQQLHRATFAPDTQHKDGPAQANVYASRAGSSSNLHEADNIKVAVRVRPLLPFEKEKGATSVLNVAKDNCKVEVVVPGPSGTKLRDFQFHACLGPEATQSEVLQLCGVHQLLDAALAGFNVTIFAYGMTGSGKTYTMSGREEVILQEGYKGDSKDGIVTQSVNYLYCQIKERTDSTYSLSASYLEIYNEGVYDLLPAMPWRAHLHDPTPSAAPSLHKNRTGRKEGPSALGAESRAASVADGLGGEGAASKPSGLKFGTAAPPGVQTFKPGSMPPAPHKPGSMPPAPHKPGTSAPVARDLCIKWEAGQGFHVPGLQIVQCITREEMLQVIHDGMQHRHVGSHELNIESSRSHSLMTIHCHALPSDPNAWDQGTARCGKICFVDLAGSERLKDSKSEGSMLKETTNINKSLFVLGKVISALAERNNPGMGSAHVPYRDSKLTKLLMDSLGGSALALMVACCSPSSMHVEETLSTLSYATRAKNIQNRPSVQYDPEEAQAAHYKREIGLLRQENGYLKEQLMLGGNSPHAYNSLPPLTPPFGIADPGSSANSVVGIPPYRTGMRPPLPYSPSSNGALLNPGPLPTNNSFNSAMGEEGIRDLKGILKAPSPLPPSHMFEGDRGSTGAHPQSPSKDLLNGVQPSCPSAPQLLPLWLQQQMQQPSTPASAFPLHQQHLQRQQFLGSSGGSVRGSGEGLGASSILASRRLASLGGPTLGQQPLRGSNSLDGALKMHREGYVSGVGGAGDRASYGPPGTWHTTGTGVPVLPAPRPGSGAAWQQPPPPACGILIGVGSKSNSHPGSAGGGQDFEELSQYRFQPQLGQLNNHNSSCQQQQQQQQLGLLGNSNNGGRFSRSRPSSRPASRGAKEDMLDGQGDELMRRLQETQALLDRFSEENSLLARENDRLTHGHAPLGAEHAEVLSEIETLRERLSGLESAVKAGRAQPGAVKALLGSIRRGASTEQQSDGCRPSRHGSVSSSIDQAAHCSSSSAVRGLHANGGILSPSHMLHPQPSSDHFVQQPHQVAASQPLAISAHTLITQQPQQPQQQQHMFLQQPDTPEFHQSVQGPPMAYSSRPNDQPNHRSHLQQQQQQQQQLHLQVLQQQHPQQQQQQQQQQLQQQHLQQQQQHLHLQQQHSNPPSSLHHQQHPIPLRSPYHHHHHHHHQQQQQQQQQQLQMGGGGTVQAHLGPLHTPTIPPDQPIPMPSGTHSRGGSALTQPPPPPPPTGAAVPKPGDKLVITNPAKFALLFG